MCSLASLRRALWSGVAVLSAAIAASLMLAGGASAHHAKKTRCANADATPGSISIGASKRATLCMLNEQRRKRGLTKLRMNKRLTSAAKRHSRDMRKRKYFAHERRRGLDLTKRVKRTGYLKKARRWLLAENIGWGSGDSGTPRALVDAWMHSRGHRRNIVDRKLRQVGIGLIWGAPVRGASKSLARRSAIYTTDFGVLRRR